MCARGQQEEAGLFLVKHSANANYTNSYGEGPLHAACRHGLAQLTRRLLLAGSNPNAQTTAALLSMKGMEVEEEEEVEEEIEEEVEIEEEEEASPSHSLSSSSSHNQDFSNSRPKSLALNHRVELNPFADDMEEDHFSPLSDTNPFAEDMVEKSPVRQKTPTTPQRNVEQPKPKIKKTKIVKRLVKTKKKVSKLPVYRQTPLHVAIVNMHKHVVEVFLQYKGMSFFCTLHCYTDLSMHGRYF